jgi:hypothetical protein
MLHRRQKKEQLMTSGVGLANWLNSGKTAEAVDRVKKVIRLLQQLQAALRPGTPLWKLPEATRLEKELEGVTRRYLTWPRFAVASDASSIGIAHMWERGGLEETNALGIIEGLLRAGELGRLALCEGCRERWLFRYRRRKHCDDKCRQLPYEAKPQRIAAKRKRSRDRYWYGEYGNLKRHRRRRKYAEK